MVVILAMGIGLFAPPFGVGYYAACAIGRVDPADGIRPIWGYLVALVHRHHHRRRRAVDLDRVFEVKTNRSFVGWAERSEAHAVKSSAMHRVGTALRAFARPTN